MPVISLKKALRGKPVPNKLHYEFCRYLQVLFFHCTPIFPFKICCAKQKSSRQCHITKMWSHVPLTLLLVHL